jgi:hypothetical protein
MRYKYTKELKEKGAGKECGTATPGIFPPLDPASNPENTPFNPRIRSI